jgi:transcriptional regulator with XRE-family HTH domain
MTVKPKPETETPDRLTLLGDELRALRKAQGLTPQALAEASGETTAVVGRANTPPTLRQ